MPRARLANAPDVARLLDGVAERSNDILALGQVLGLLQVFSQRLARDRHDAAVDELILQQVLEHAWTLVSVHADEDGVKVLGMPPILKTCSITYLPEGLRSARKGVRSDTVWKSSIVSLMPTECAMAMRCRTMLVEPPRIIVRTCPARQVTPG
jgi:hypothetical protein